MFWASPSMAVFYWGMIGTLQRLNATTKSRAQHDEQRPLHYAANGYRWVLKA
jgi:hypothetical protein